jgi:hypothetical protein
MSSNALSEKIIRLIQSEISNSDLKRELSGVPPDALAESILVLIRSSLNSGKNLKTVLKPAVAREIAASLNESRKSNVAKLILKLIQNSVTANKVLTKPVAAEAMKIAGAPNSNSILKIIHESLAKNETPAKAEEIKVKISQAPKPVNKNTANLIFRIITNLFRTNGKKMANFVAANTFRQANRPKNGRKWYFGTKGEGTGWHLNTGGVVVGPTGRPNFSKLNLSALLKWRRENPGNSANVNSAISKFIKEMMNKIRSSSERLARLVELLKQLPPNFSGRREIVAAIIAMIREITNLNRFSNFNRNLRGVNNRNIRNALEIQRRRIQRRRTEERRPVNNYERRAVGDYRRPGESNGRRRNEADALKRAIARAEPPRPRPIGNYGPGPTENYGTNGNAIRRALARAEPPPLPPSQNAAINNVGGAGNAVQAVAQVPGGAPEVAKAAEALNETGGNVRLAIETKGVSPAAVNAVQKLGGVSQTVKILEGLNTMAQTPETRRRKARQPKKVSRGIRLTELNRVIAAVKKQKLISLMAHNVTRTNNIHPNDEKLKKYYRKVMKSYLLKKPFANIVKRAAKKRVQ